MPNYRVLNRAIFLILLVAGQTSCTPDKPAQSEPLKLQAPYLELEAGGSLAWAQIAATKDRPVTSSAELTFPDGAQGAQVEIESRCHWQSRIWTNKKTFQAPRKLMLLELLPPPVMVGTPGTVARCQFGFIATNSYGSRHLFFLNDLDVTLVASGRGLEVKRDNQFVEASSTKAITPPPDEWSRLALAAPELRGPLELVCEQSHLTLTPHSYLLFAQVETTRRSPHTEGAELFPHQYCRFIGQLRSGETAISPLIRWSFARKSPLIMERVSSSPPMIGPYIHLGSAAIQNPLNREIVLRLPHPGRQVLRGRASNGRDSADFEVGVQFHFTITSGKVTNQPTPLGIELRLGPQAEVTIAAQASHQVRCHLSRFPKIGSGVSQAINVYTVFAPTDIGPEVLQIGAVAGTAHDGEVMEILPLWGRTQHRSMPELSWLSAEKILSGPATLPTSACRVVP